MQKGRYGRFDTISLGGMAVFGALAVVLTTISQALGLNFPVVPYLQFDFGEVAILLAFFIFGPVPALIASLVEFGTLMAIGQNVAYFGPELKLISILSSLLGIWLGTVIVARTGRATIGRAVGVGTTLGMVMRAAVMTIPNYILIVFLFTVPGIVGFVAGGFKLLGVTITAENALGLVLALTALFNLLQLLLVSGISYLLIRLPQVQSTRAAGRAPWILTYMRRSGGPTLSRPASP